MSERLSGALAIALAEVGGSTIVYPPRATTLPDLVMENIDTPSPTNPLGAKGVGSVSTVPSPVAVTNAVLDALSDLGIRHIDMPLTPEKVWRAIRDAGTPRVMTGFRMVGRGIPRHGLAVMKDGEQVGTVTSGTHSPTLDANIGMGYVDRGLSAEGTRFEIDVRGRLVEAEVVSLPFYSRKRG
ncbi:MAG: hypothetical protein IIC29_09310 [Chloroflexi bacterium]|nr:hypothetical protein [Chloroflexota bacterium]